MISLENRLIDLTGLRPLWRIGAIWYYNLSRNCSQHEARSKKTNRPRGTGTLNIKNWICSFFSKIYFIFHCILTTVQQVHVQQLKMYYVDCVLKSIVATRNVITTHNVINSHYYKIVNILIFRTRIVVNICIMGHYIYKLN